MRASRARVAVCAVGPSAWPSPAEAFPAFVVAQRGDAASGMHVVHLRLPPSADLTRLPGLVGSPPSRLRDAVSLVHAAGVEAVDVVVARAPGLTPWDLAAPDAVVLLEPVLESIPGVVVTFPDASGPPPRGRMHPPAAVRLGTLAMAVRWWSAAMARSYQTLLVDLPPVDDGLLWRLFDDLAGSEAGLCMWTGDERAIARHGFRSAAALVAGLASSTKLPSDSLVGRRVRLGGGRPAPPMRLADLGVPIPRRTVPEVAERATIPVALDLDGETATIGDEPTLRNPAGTWPLPMLRMAKLVHHRVVLAANAFTFREANEEQALLLHAALKQALGDLERMGLIGGRNPGDRVDVRAGPYRNPAEPALVAEVTAFLRPWVRKVHIDLAVRHGADPRVEVR